MYCVFNSSSFIDLNSIDKNYMTVMSGECWSGQFTAKNVEKTTFSPSETIETKVKQWSYLIGQ